MQYRKKEVITAVSILVAALAIIFYVIPNYIDMEEEYELASLSPAFFPNLAAWVIAALAGWLYLLYGKQKKRIFSWTGGRRYPGADGHHDGGLNFANDICASAAADRQCRIHQDSGRRLAQAGSDLYRPGPY